jgi:hypothetical protein
LRMPNWDLWSCVWPAHEVVVAKPPGKGVRQTSWHTVFS